MEGLFYLFALSVIISGIMVISALNPVHSVLWLIVAFTSASALFILLEVEFIALILLIVYVGAIAILFLFVIMMLNLTDLEGGADMSNYLPVGFIIGVVFLFEIFGGASAVIGGVQIKETIPASPGIPWTGAEASNIESLGRVLYTSYYYLFIIASFILLGAMIGAIILTHDTRTEIKRQDIFIQISRQLWI
uniref:NADH-ubiquinone oxidoreductase chain 6 n=1 Tax=Plenaster craigi TaxID=2021432 RepID=A0A291L4K6_9METZ|nr:NADH dehydrogenase subunit 6 [Plenaster craigi]